MSKVADLFAELSLRATDFRRGLQQATADAQVAGREMSVAFGERPQRAIDETEKAVKRMTWNTRGYLKDIGRVITGILISQAFYKLLQTIEQAGAAVFEFSEHMETAAVAFKIMLGSEQEATNFLNVLKDFAATTPFSVDTARQSAQMLMALGISAENVVPILRDVADAASLSGADPEIMTRITRALGQIQTAGRVTSRDLMQLAQAGIPAFKILQEELGLTQDQIVDIGNLHIPADIGLKALLTGMEKRFKGASEAVSKTMAGMTSTIKDDLLLISEGLFSSTYAKIKAVTTKITASLEGMRKAYQQFGVGGLLKKMFTPETAGTVGVLLGAVKSLAGSFMILWGAIKPVVMAIGGYLVQGLKLVLPIFAILVRWVAMAAAWMTSCTPAVRYLVAAIMGLLVASYATAAITKLALATKLLAICQVAGNAVIFLAKAVRVLFIAMSANPIVAVIMIIAAALIGLAMSSKTVSAWLDNVMKKLTALGGVDVDSLMQPSTDGDEFNKAWDKYNQNLTDSAKNMKGFGKEADKNKKKTKDWIAEFDEVFNIPNSLDGATDALKGLDDFGGMPDFKVKPIDTKAITDNLEKVKKGIDDTLKKVPIVITPKVEPPSFPGNYAVVTEGFFKTYAIRIQKWATDTNLQIADAVKGWEFKVRDGCINLGKAIQGWVTNTGKSIQDWAGNTGKSVTNWATNTGKAVQDWTKDFNKRMNEWRVGTGATVSSWAADVATRLAKWRTDTQSSLATWATNTSVRFNAWSRETTANFNTWVTGTAANLKVWATNTGITVGNWVKATSKSLNNWFNAEGMNAYNWVNNTISNFGVWSKTTSSTVASWVTGTSKGLANWVTTTSTNFANWANGVSTAISSWASNSWSTMSSWLSGTGAGIYDWASKSISNIVGWAQGALNTIGQLAKSAGKSVSSTLGAAGSGIGSAAKGIGGWAGDHKGAIAAGIFAAAVTGAIIATIATGGAAAPLLAVAALETGGIVKKDTIIRAGEKNHREAVVPLDNPAYMRPFAQAIASEMGYNGGNGGGQDYDDRPILVVGTLIADDAGIRELERKMRVIRTKEGIRRGE